MFPPNLIDRMCDKANESPISIKLAAVMLKNKRPIGPIKYNSNRTCCRGKICPSMHAEANVLSNHFGKSLKYSNGKWHLLMDQLKVFQQA